MNLYKNLKDSQQEKVSNFLHKYAFFAFSEKQFEDGLKKLGIEKGAEGLLVSLTGTGGFLLKDKAEQFKALLAENEKETAAALADPDTGTDFAYQMFYNELANHEYSYTGNLAETLDALGYTTEDINSSEVLKNALSKASKDLLAEE